MDAIILDWLNLIIRWTHIIVAIAWIGSSFYFMWLDSHLEAPTVPSDEVEGELWMVHSGGFYRVDKIAVAPKVMPRTLHWFKCIEGRNPLLFRTPSPDFPPECSSRAISAKDQEQTLMP